MTETPIAETKLENTYLKFFKFFIVFMMTLALLAILALLPLAAYNFMQQPIPPTPVREPPTRSITANDLKTFLIDEEKRRIEAEKGVAPSSQQPASAGPVTLLYGEHVLRLYRCSEEFRKNAEQPVDNSSQAEIVQRNERLRASIESRATDRFLGPAWVNAMVEFTCSVLTSPDFAKLKKDKLVGLVVGPTISFHANAWSRIEREKANFRAAEEARVAAETAAEAARVGAARVRGLTMLVAAGSCLAAFLLLALYLIFAKIEFNLRLLHLSSLRYEPPGHRPQSTALGTDRPPIVPAGMLAAQS